MISTAPLVASAPPPGQGRVEVKAYILKTGRRISPFGDPPGECPVLNRPLLDVQKEVIAGAGLEPQVIDDLRDAAGGDFFLILDHVYISRGAFRLFRDQALCPGRSCALAIPEGRFTAFTESMQLLRRECDGATGRRLLVYGVFYLEDESYSPELAARLPPERIEIREREQKLSLPPT